jgi:hypothetical protein
VGGEEAQEAADERNAKTMLQMRRDSSR